MKTNEFINKANNLGYNVEHLDRFLYITDNHDNNVANIDTGKELGLQVSIATKPTRKLFDFMVEYTTTTLDEREDESLYRVLLTDKGLENFNFKYVYISKAGTIEFAHQLEDIDTLTEKEIRDIDERYLVFKVPVETKEEVKLTRKDVVEKAQNYVSNLINAHGVARFMRNGYVVPKFIVNEEKRTVVALLQYFDGEIAAKGKAKATEDDVFNADIGKAIALARALVNDVPEEFVNAPQPERAEVGMIVKNDLIIYRLTSRANENDGVLDGGRAFYLDDDILWTNESSIKNILSDSDVQY